MRQGYAHQLFRSDGQVPSCISAYLVLSVGKIAADQSIFQLQLRLDRFRISHLHHDFACVVC
jgi:hypothetical protein